MSAAPSFTEAVRSIASRLRENTPSDPDLNHAASQIDHLGRQLHGLGLSRDREIADCFTAAIRELGAARSLQGEERAEGVREAAHHLEAAMTRTQAGDLQS